MAMSYHNPVLLHPAVDGLDIKSDGIYVDITFGGGGHSREILKRLGKEGKLFAFDQDEDALANEIGVSSHQFDSAERGFSTRFEGDLDMRMSRRNQLSAYDVINSFEVDRLRQVFRDYGEIRNAEAMARAIVASREKEPIRTSSELKSVLERFLPRHREHKILAQVYQAVRIEVNQELEAIKEFLLQTPGLLYKGGRLSIISYHSLEDRLVKRFIQTGNFEGELQKDFYGKPLKPFDKVGNLIVPTAAEIAENNRARSAKLRIAERL